MERDHDLSGALFGIEAAAAALSERRECLPSGDVDALVAAIASEARRLRAMLAPAPKQLTDFDLADAIRPAVVVSRAAGVVVRDDVPRGVRVRGVAGDVVEVVLELLDNARVHAAPSAVDVRVASDDETTTLYIEDRGPGISGLDGRAVFERGRRGPASCGSGLGLFIARRLMAEQAGSLTVEARPGGGASFAVSLPTAASTAPRRRPAAALQRRFR